MTQKRDKCCAYGCHRAPANDGSPLSAIYCEQHIILRELESKEGAKNRRQWIATMIECINDGDEEGFDYERNIVCPWCGAEWEADFESEYYCAEGDHEETCYECEKNFVIRTDIDISYSTKRGEESA